MSWLTTMTAPHSLQLPLCSAVWHSFALQSTFNEKVCLVTWYLKYTFYLKYLVTMARKYLSRKEIFATPWT